MNIVFLDIDGVVNTPLLDTEPFDLINGKTKKDGFYYGLAFPTDKKLYNRQAIMLLNKLCIEYDAKIVISSTWKVLGITYLKELLVNSGLIDSIEVIDTTPHVEDFRLTRGEEIQEYLDNHPEVVNYVILDDEDRMLPSQQEHFVKINYYVGISIPDYEHAKMIFNKTLDKDYELKREK